MAISGTLRFTFRSLCIFLVLTSSVLDFANGSVTTAVTYPVCPLTGLKPAVPKVLSTRCLDANVASCCSDCTDIRFGLAMVSAMGSNVVAALAPSFASMLEGNDFGICDRFFSEYPECGNYVEQMICAVNCNPESGNYVVKKGGVPDITICKPFAETAYKACYNIPTPILNVPLGSLLSTPEQLLGQLFGGFAGAIGIGNFTVSVVAPKSAKCYGGPIKTPEVGVCCDSLNPSVDCPCASLGFDKNPDSAKYVQRSLNETVCGSGTASLAAVATSQCLPSSYQAAASSTPSSPPSPTTAASTTPDQSSKGKAGSRLLLQAFSILLSIACTSFVVLLGHF